MYCIRCGHAVTDGARFCPGCGAPLEPTAAPRQPSAFSRFFSVPDTTADYTPAQIAEGKALAVLSYLMFLVIIPLLAGKDKPFVRYHVNQGILLLAAAGVVHVIQYLPFVGSLFYALGILCVLALAVVGIVNAASGRARELPIIGQFTIL